MTQTHRPVDPSRIATFETILEHISDGVVLTDANGIVTYRSPAVTRITGVSYEDALGTSVFNLIHPRDKAAAESYFLKSQSRSGQPFSATIRLLDFGGREIWVEGTIVNLTEANDLHSFVINFRDVTSQKAAERRVRDSEARLRTVFDHTSVAYVLINPEFRVLLYNKVAEKKYFEELKAELRSGDYILEYLPKQRQEKIGGYLSNAIHGRQVAYDLYFDKGGSRTWYEVKIVPIFDESRILGAIICSEEVTERKASQIKAEELNKRLLAKNIALRKFAYIVSHKLRAPVSRVLGLSQVLDSVRSEEEEARCITGIIDSVKDLDKILHDLNTIVECKVI